MAISLIENATLEDNNDIHTLWSNLLVNAMDPKTSHQVKHIHSSIERIRTAGCGNIIFNNKREITKESRKKFSEIRFDRSKLVDLLKVSPETVELSLLNLMRLARITPGIIINTNIKAGGLSPTTFKGTELFHLSPLGQSLFEAVQ